VCVSIAVLLSPLKKKSLVLYHPCPKRVFIPEGPKLSVPRLSYSYVNFVIDSNVRPGMHDLLFSVSLSNLYSPHVLQLF